MLEGRLELVLDDFHHAQPVGEFSVFGIEISHLSCGVIRERPDLVSTSIHYGNGFASGYGDHLVCLLEGVLGDPAGLAFGLDPRGLEELHSLGAHGAACLGRFIEHQTGGLSSNLVELMIQGGSALTFTIESLRRLRLLVDGFFQFTFKFGDAFLGGGVLHHGGTPVVCHERAPPCDAHTRDNFLPPQMASRKAMTP